MSVRRILGAAIAASAVCCALALPAGAQAAKSDPVLFVHGWNGNASNWDTFRTHMRWLGFTGTFKAITLNGSESQNNEVAADRILNEVNSLKASTGRSKVDIVTHSMGGLSSRYYLKNKGGTSSVDEWVSIAGPNHGSLWANTPLCSSAVACAQMQYYGSWINSLNAGDETPGSVRYMTLTSLCDELVQPVTSTALSGATNKTAGCLEHATMILLYSVAWQVGQFLD